jgi:transposase
MITSDYSTPTTPSQSQTRRTYPQNWPAYNAVQTHEQEQFTKLLRELCDTVPQPPQTFGRPRLPLSDVLFGIGLKVYSTMSGRRAMTDFRDAQAKGLLDKVPSFTSTFRYLENPDLAPLLKDLIERSALPLRSVETDFAVDASGFSTSVYKRWFDYKWGKTRKEAKWIKAHLMCGVKTNIVTSVDVTPTDSADALFLAPFVQTTARNFDVDEVSGDKAYLSKKNLRAVQAVGGTAYIPFKVNSVGHQGHHKRDSLWERTYHYYNFNRSEFLAHYHKRSNVETTFSMVKAKFGGSVRSKTPVAQVNEVLVKILCHNICVLIQSIYELGIEPIFGTETFGTKEAVVPKVAWQ